MAALSLTEPRFAVLPGGARISYLEAGTDNGALPPLVLLHGMGSAARSWRDQLTGLSRNRRVVAWDAPGYGESTPLAPELPDAGDYARAALGFIDHLGIGRCHLVGHSLGTLMAARFAATWPERLFSVSFSGLAIGHAELPAEESHRLLHSRLDDMATLGPAGMAQKRGPRLLAPGAAPDVIASVIETMGMAKLPGYVQAARMLSGGNALADIARIPASLPVQFLYALDDVITPPADNLKGAALRPEAPAHAIRNAGHAAYLEQPALFNDILARFMEAHDGRP